MRAKNEGYICVLDCEAVPDVGLLRASFDFGQKGLGEDGAEQGGGAEDGPGEDGSGELGQGGGGSGELGQGGGGSGELGDAELSLLAMQIQKQKTGSNFLPLPYHRVISICAVLADSFGRFIRVNKIEGEGEEEMLRNFFSFIDKFEPRLVSFNGKNYDLPLLVLRALKYGIRAVGYLDASDKWNNYKTRFSEAKHCDLFEVLGGRGLTLDLLCKLAGAPGKYELAGDDVLGLFYEGRLEKIHEYCESDVLNTYLLFLRYEFIKGNLTEADYADFLGRMRDFLTEKRASAPYTPVFAAACAGLISRLTQGL